MRVQTQDIIVSYFLAAAFKANCYESTVIESNLDEQINIRINISYILWILAAGQSQDSVLRNFSERGDM